jgi:hypothetical protein
MLIGLKPNIALSESDEGRLDRIHQTQEEVSTGKKVSARSPTRILHLGSVMRTFATRKKRIASGMNTRLC